MLTRSTARALRTTPSLASSAAAASQRRGLARMSIIGRLGAEPEVVPTSTGRDVIRYAIATSTGPRDANETSWFRVSSFVEGPQKDLIAGLPKGAMVHVEADSRMRSYEDAQGVKRTQLDLVQRSIEILSRPRGPSESTVQEAEGMAASA